MTKSIDPHLLDMAERLMLQHKGRDRSIKTCDVADMLGVTEPEVRRITAALTIGRHIPIASVASPGAMGYAPGLFVAVTQDEKDQYAAQLESRMRSMYQRLRAFKSIYIEQLEGGRQGELFNAEA